MTKVKSLWLVALLLLGAMLPWFLGWYAQQQILNYAAAWNDAQLLRQPLQLRIDSYQRGWLRSHVQGVIGFANQPLWQQLEFTTVVQHGPWGLGSEHSHASAGTMLQLESFLGLFSTVTHLHSSDVQLQTSLTAAGAERVAQLNLTAKFFAPLTFTIALPALNTAASDAGGLVFAGAQVDGILDARSGGLRLEATVPALRLTGREGRLQLDGGSATFVGVLSQATPWPLGQGRLRIQQLQLSGANTPMTKSLDLRDVGVGCDTALDSDQFLQLAIVGELSELRLRQDRHITQLKFGLDGQRLSPAPLTGGVASGWIRQLLQPGAQVTLEPAQFVLDGEPVTASVRVNAGVANSATVQPGFPSADAGLLRWALALSVNGALTLGPDVAQELAERRALNDLGQVAHVLLPDQLAQMASVRAPLLLESWRQRGFVVREESGYAASFSLDQGDLTLNDKAVALSAWPF